MFNLENNITAKVIAQSINDCFGITITTYELEYPRFIHGEFMTHREFSRNAASSRAIPISAVIENILKNPATPVWYGEKQTGMQANKQLDSDTIALVIQVLEATRGCVIEAARVLDQLKLHKQITNRILEPFQMIKVIVTSTSYDNFMWLRNHKDTQPELQVLAQKMEEAESDFLDYVYIRKGDWHLPYVNCKYEYVYNMEKERDFVVQTFYDENDNKLKLEEALQVSASCCAQISYRKNDASFEKAKDIFDRLIHSDRVHASPTEHQARAITRMNNPMDYFQIEGVTGLYKQDEGVYIPTSGNLKGFVQYRQLIPNNVCKT